MLNVKQKKKLNEQGYRLIGNHSSVKRCEWTKNMIRGKGECYKHWFYGINSNQCLQMTTSLTCANQCMFCWREYKLASKKWPIKDSQTDNPDFIINESIKSHDKLLTGFKGNTNPNPDKEPYNKSKTIKHAALSLIGESILYPKINEIINEFHKKGISTFLVTNAQYPEQIKSLAPVTQLYISLDAPTQELIKKIDKPIFKDYWQRLNQSLEIMSKKKQRTCIRLTLIKYVNMSEDLCENYSNLIKKASPDFIEVKAYMSVGASLKNFKYKNMPTSKEIMQFSQKLIKYLKDYEIVSEHYASRVVMLAKKKFKKDINGEPVWHTWIDFDKFNKLVNSKSNNNKNNKEFTTEDYLKETPERFLVKNINLSI